MNGPPRRYTPTQRFLKSIEVGFKRVFLALLTRMAARSPDATPNWDARKQRILFLRHDRIGDMIVSTGIIHAIAMSHANIELDVLASPMNAAVLEQDPLVHHIVRFDRYRMGEYWKLLRYLRKVRYDVVVDCMVFGQSLTTLLLMLATRAPHRVGVPKAGKPNVYTMPVLPAGPSAHHVEHLAQLAIPFGVKPEDALKLGIVLTDAETTAALAQWNSGTAPRFLVNVSAGKSFRQWSNERFAQVAQHLKARVPGARVMILHGPGERERAEAIATEGGVTRAETPSVRQAFAMVATANFVFTPDTSIVHAASAFRVPTVAMFTGDHAMRWGLFHTPGEVVVCPGETLATVPLDEAIAAIDRQLSTLALH